MRAEDLALWSGWSVEKISDELASEHCQQFYSGEGSGADLGFVFYRVVDDEAWIINIAVKNKGKGNGRRLMDAFIEALQASQNIKFLGLEVRESNLAARALYEKFEFVEIGRRKAYYPEGDDALVYRRKI